MAGEADVARAVIAVIAGISIVIAVAGIAVLSTLAVAGVAVLSGIAVVAGWQPVAVAVAARAIGHLQAPRGASPRLRGGVVGLRGAGKPPILVGLAN